MGETTGFRFTVCFLLAALGTQTAAKPSEPNAVSASHLIQQVALSDMAMAHYLTATPALTAIIAQAGEDPGKPPDPHLLADLNIASQHYGFANYADYEAVADNIVWILTGIDPLSRKFIGIQAVTREQAADVVANKSLSAKEHKRRIEVLHAQILIAAPVKFADNVALVTKYYDRLMTLKQN